MLVKQRYKVGIQVSWLLSQGFTLLLVMLSASLAHILVSVWLLPKAEPETRIWEEEIYLRSEPWRLQRGSEKERDKAGGMPTCVHATARYWHGHHPTSDSLRTCVKCTSELS